MKFKKWTIGALVLVGLLLGGLVSGIALSGQPGRASAAPAAQTADQCQEDDDDAEATEVEDLDDVEEEVECGPQDENETDEAGISSDADCANQDDDGAEIAGVEDTDDVEMECGPQDENEDGETTGVDESDETAPAGLSLTADQAQAIVEAANPGIATLAVEYDRENGKNIWEVELKNGMDVKVDANSGQILKTETRD